MPLNAALATDLTPIEISGRRAATIILSAAAIAHLTFWSAIGPRVWLDSHRYTVLSENFWGRLASGAWELNTPAGYPFFLWVFSRVSSSTVGIALAQQILAIATCGLVALIAYRLAGSRTALASGLLVALAPNRHYYAQSVLGETWAEFLLVGAIAALLSVNRSAGSRLLLGRALSSALFVAATLVRPNLAPFALLAPLVPPGDRKLYLRSAVLASACTLALALPWVIFKARLDSAGVGGFVGAGGYVMTGFLNEFRVGAPVALGPLHAHTPVADRALWESVRRRIQEQPLAYLHAASVTFVALLALRPSGDVGPAVRLAADLPPPGPLAVFHNDASRARWPLRLRIHRALCMAYDLVLPIAWIGLAVGAWRAAQRGEWPTVFVAAGSFGCVLSLVAALLRNSRYVFPLEAIALSQMFLWRRLQPESR